MSDLTTVARPYAKAVFELAIETSKTDSQSLKRWAATLDFLARLVEENKIQTFLKKPQSALKIAEKIIELSGDQLDKQGQNLVKIMTENGRLILMPIVFKEYKSLVDKHFAIAEVSITSAFPLNQVQQQKIVQAMEKKLAQKINLNCSVDKSLLAGIVIRTDDMVIDGSSLGQLQKLARNLQL